MSEKASTLALAPFVRIFIYSAIKSIRHKNLSGRKIILHADMVPRVTENVMLASMKERTVSYNSNLIPGMSASKNIVEDIKPIPKPLEQKAFEPKPKLNIPVLQMNNQLQTSKQDLIPSVPVVFASQLQKPIPPKTITPNQVQNIPKQNAPPVQQMIMPELPVTEGEELTQFYGKITPLLGDLSVTAIECSGAGKPLMVVRRGRRTQSKIVLSEADIGQILQKVSDAAHIPLMDGVFRAAVDTFSINAVVSDVIGSRFVIRLEPLVSQGSPSVVPPQGF